MLGFMNESDGAGCAVPLSVMSCLEAAAAVLLVVVVTVAAGLLFIGTSRDTSAELSTEPQETNMVLLQSPSIA
jgi:hypothetical protein